MLVGRFAQPQVSPGVLVPVWGGWMEKTGMGYNGGAAELMQRAELCIGFLCTAGMQRSHWCGAFGWLPAASLLRAGEPQLWHSSRQSIPSPLRVPPCPSGASQTKCLMSGSVFSNAQKCQKDRLVLAMPACSLQPLLPMILLAGRWQDMGQHAGALGSLNSFKRCF